MNPSKMDLKETEPNVEALPALDRGESSGLQRRLVTAHIVMVSLGSSIGMGLWLGSGKSLATSGPASLFLGFVLGSTIIWSLTQSIGEMAVMYPVPSAFVQWTNRFVDPSAGFVIGWAYWAMYAISTANELQGLVTVLRFWTQSLPVAGLLTLFLVSYMMVHVGAVSVFGNIEVVVSSIKFLWIIVVVISCIVISAGGAPNGDKIGFRYWNSAPFINGFKGFLAVMPHTIFAFGGSENAAMVISELRNPQKSVPSAVRSIWIRLGVFYLLGSLAVTITTDPKDPDLFGNKGTGASPFVLAFRNAGIVGLAHAMNAIIFLSVFSSGLVATFAGPRTTVGLAQIGMAPSILSKADRMGRPWPGLILVFAVGGGLSYLNVSHGGAEVFGWLSNITSSLTLFGWGMIAFSHLRFRKAWALQGRSAEDLPWRSATFPWTTYWTVFWCIILIIVQFYLSIWPIGKKPSAKYFFANYISIVLIVVTYVFAKFCWYRGPLLVDLNTVGLDEERRFYERTDNQLEQKRSRKWWRVPLGVFTSKF